MAERVTIKQVANKLGVSMMTVSRALNNRPNVDEKTKKRVMETAREMGYIQNHIAKSLVQKRTFTVGIVVPEITHSFFPDAIKGMEEVINLAGYQIIFTHSAEDSKKEVAAIETLASKRVDGILISMAESVRDFSIYKQIINMKLPIVFFDRCVHNLGASCVGINDDESSFNITEYLVKKGYSKIAHLAGPTTISIGRERLNGYKRALLNSNIEVKDEYIKIAGLHETGGYEAMKELLSSPSDQLPEAVVCVNDPCAFGAMNAIKEAGLKIPEDIAVVGFTDDIRANLVTPSLTTIKQPAYEIGRKAAEKLIAHIENDSEPVEDIYLATEIVERKSTGI
ncbi:MAG: LacI family DNA-binding transcriptional regulator [Rhodothermaceae bacterium]